MAMGRLRMRFDAAMARWYMPREVLVRSDGRMRYFVLSRRRQMVASGLVAVALLLPLVLAAGWIVTGYRLGQRSDEVAAHHAAYLELLAEVANYSDEFAALARNMEANEKALLALIDGSGGGVPGSVDRDAIEAQVALSQAVRAEGLAGSAGLRQKLHLFASDLQSVVARNEQLAATITVLEAQLAAAEADRREVVEARDDLASQLGETEAKLAAADQRTAALERTIGELEAAVAAADRQNRSERNRSAALQQQLAALEQHLENAVAHRARVEQRLNETQRRLDAVRNQREILAVMRDQLSGEVTQLRNRIAAIELSQQAVVERLAERTRGGVAEIEKIVAMTGVDVDTLLQRVKSDVSGLGGPFIPARQRPPVVGSQIILATVAPLDLEMGRWEKLHAVLRSLPISAPLDSYSIGSSFGTRKDPFNGKLAMHEGLDFTAAMESPVLATAPGKVVFAGRKGSYGKMVEIDHGFGIRTRYAHLKSILVEVGQTVEYRDKIGKLGTSGRSTGPHVHYEILVDGKPYDPMNFLKAGRYVFKG